MNLTSVVQSSASNDASMRDADISAIIQTKAEDADVQAALTLIDAIPKPQNLPPNLGRNINTTA
ncbi:MAG: hypothetical protein NVSMB6_16060 [Burkholderiaceae bacterium]